jgi:hypothetical protein
MSHSVYFGGSRHLSQDHPVYNHIAPVVLAVMRSGCSVHVGCQSGADQTVLLNALRDPSRLSVFAVAPTIATAPPFVERAFHAGASVTLAAGTTTAHIKAQYLLRSKAAFAGCSQAIFFAPGTGSLAVARECVKASIPVFAFSCGEPARIPSTAGGWLLVSMHSYYAPFSNATAQVYTWQAVQQIQLF